MRRKLCNKCESEYPPGRGGRLEMVSGNIDIEMRLCQDCCTKIEKKIREI